MKIFLAECNKLFLLFRADPKSIMAGIIAPTIILIIFALTFGNFSPLKLAVINEDDGSYGSVLEASVFSQYSPLGNTPYFEKVATDRTTALRLYEKGAVNGILILEADFSRQFEVDEEAHIAYLFNNYNTDMAKNMRLYLSEGILNFYKITDPALHIEVEEILNVETQLHWFDIIAVAVFLLAFLLGAMFNALYLFYKVKTYATLHEYWLSPKILWPSLIARICMALFAGSITASVNALFIWLLTGVNLAQHIPGLLLPLLILGVIHILFAITIALSLESFSGAAIFTMASTVILWFFSGATASIKYATGMLRTIAMALPNTYGLNLIRGEVFAMDPSLGEQMSVTSGWMIMLVYLIIAAFLAVYVYHKKLANRLQ